MTTVWIRCAAWGIIGGGLLTILALFASFAVS